MHGQEPVKCTTIDCISDNDIEFNPCGEFKLKIFSCLGNTNYLIMTFFSDIKIVKILY
jgi:hypothetical protein